MVECNGVAGHRRNLIYARASGPSHVVLLSELDGVVYPQNRTAVLTVPQDFSNHCGHLKSDDFSNHCGHCVIGWGDPMVGACVTVQGAMRFGRDMILPSCREFTLLVDG